jgi:hypothetical protein
MPRIFIVGAIVLIVFGIIAAAAASQTFLSVQWYIWLMASLLSFYTDILLGWAGPVLRSRAENVPQA